jgi:hypothetical protein
MGRVDVFEVGRIFQCMVFTAAEVEVLKPSAVEEKTSRLVPNPRGFDHA